jgi:glycosyltransferase involved in cell wall biosynthesis
MILWRLKNAVRDADAVTLHSMYSFPVLAGYMLARFYGKPFGIWPHGVFAPFQRQISSFKKWLYDHLIGRRILSKASVIFYSAAGERDETSPLRLAAPSVIVPHGMDWKEFLHLPPKGIFRKRYFPGFDGELVVFLARLNAKKGLDILIKAMSKVIAAKPNTRLAIIGPPDPASFGHKVEQWVNDEGIGASVVITGAIVNEAKREALADADVFVLASQAENFGFSVFEAMASRVPVVVSNTLNYAEEIARAGAGISIERTPGDCAEAIVRLLDDSDLRHRMGQAGAVLARSYSWDATGERVERTFDCVFRNIPLPSDLTEVKLGVSRG